MESRELYLLVKIQLSVRGKVKYMIKDLFREKLQTIVGDYKITLKTLSQVTGINYVWLTDYINGKGNYNDLSVPDRSSLWDMLMMLSDGVPAVKEDNRIKAVIRVLVDKLEISHETLAIYAGIEIEDVQNFMENPDSISYEKKYKLATVALFLHYLFKKTKDISIDENDKWKVMPEKNNL